MRMDLLNKRIELSNKWFGALAAFGAMFMFLWVAAIGYDLLCLPFWCAEAEGIMSMLVPSALAGFATGVLLASQLTLWQMKWGSVIFGVSMGAISLTDSYSFSPEHFLSYAVLALFAVPTLATISANRGMRLRQEKKWTHLIWLAMVVGALLATYAAVERISDTADPLPVVKHYKC